MKLALSTLVVLGASFMTTACQTIPYQGQARDVKRKPGVGGTIAVPINPQQADRDRAAEHMISNCGNGNYKITEEGEVVTGETTQASTRNDFRQNTQQTTGTFLGMPIVSGDPGGVDSATTSTRTLNKEWQMTYECVAQTTSTSPMPAPKPKPRHKKKK
jgi:hypothetical protein